jgi:hypothetical protein
MLSGSLVAIWMCEKVDGAALAPRVVLEDARICKAEAVERGVARRRAIVLRWILAGFSRTGRIEVLIERRRE